MALFRVGDRVVSKNGDIGEVMSVDDDFEWGQGIQPIKVLFDSMPQQLNFTQEGKFRDDFDTNWDIRLLSPLDELL